MAAHKFLKNLLGIITEEAAIESSAGAGDEGKLVALDGSGRLDQSFMPVGITPETASIVTSENLADGDWVNVYNNGGVVTARKADATTNKPAHGFVLAASTSPAPAIVFFEGSNTHLVGVVAGDQFLLTVAGTCGITAPSGSGNIVQRVGVATSSTSVQFEPSQPIVLL